MATKILVKNVELCQFWFYIFKCVRSSNTIDSIIKNYFN